VRRQPRNRQRILEAAQELYAERGQAVTLSEIARHAGVAVGTVYRRFPDKDELVEGLCEQRIDRLAEILDRALANPDPWRGFVDFFEASLEETGRRPRAPAADARRRRRLRAHCQGARAPAAPRHTAGRTRP
jgi:AcrR family transcriptional regulator